MENNIENPTPEMGNEPEVKVEEDIVKVDDLEFATTDELIAQVKKDAETKKQLHARAVKAEAKAKEIKPKDEQKIETNNTPQGKLTVEERVDLRLSGYSPEEVNFIERNGGLNALKDEVIVAAIEGIRAKKKSQEATPEGSPKSPIYKKYSQQDLAKMSLEQLEKIIPRAED
jgi:hypothetical protein